MAFRIFLTEIRRTGGICISLFLLCVVSGFVIMSSLYLSEYLSNLFQDVNLGVDMVLLPKGLTPETMQKSLINGEPEALMPLALFETLQKQILDEMSRKNLPVPPLKIMGILPFHNANREIEIASVGDQDIIRGLSSTSWHSYSFKNLNDVQNLLLPKEKYETEEWKDKTLFAVSNRNYFTFGTYRHLDRFSKIRNSAKSYLSVAARITNRFTS